MDYTLWGDINIYNVLDTDSGLDFHFRGGYSQSMSRNHREPVTVPVLREALSELRDIPKNLKIIREKTRLNHTALAATLGITRRELYEWETGVRVPRVPLVTLSIILWARKLEGQENNKGEAVTPPFHG